MRKIITAIDIGTTKIVAIAGERAENDKVRILGMGSVQTPKGSVKRGVALNIELISQAIKEAVKITNERIGVEFNEAFIGIAGQHIYTRQSSHSVIVSSPDFEISKDDVEKLISDMYQSSTEPGEDILHVIPQEYTVDNNSGVDKPVGMFGKKLLGVFNVIIGETVSAKNIRKCVERIGIKPLELFLEPLASAKAVLTTEEKEAGVALIDIGGGTTDLAVYYDGKLRHTAVIPFGGDVITQDIKTGCNILHDKAEAIKVQHGKALSEFAPENSVIVVEGISGREPINISMKMIAQIIQARIEEICEIIDLEITNSGYRDKLGAGISLTGGGALLKHLPQLMKYQLGLDVKLSRPGVNIIASNKDINNPKYSTAVGLIMLGLRSVEDKENVSGLKNQTGIDNNIEENDIEQNLELEPKKRKGFFSQFKGMKQQIIEFVNDNDKEV